ncbi:hypothetical protein [Streptomyces synnematoformans]|uniref:Minor tail protein n=1 Tax=Streptomyces synnematoformans TaxID=415721 RepID=A0ABN2XBT3_9ACTN
MAQNSWPNSSYNSGAVTEAEYERTASRLSDDGIDGSPVQAAVVTAGTGLQVLVAADRYAIVRGFAWSSGSTAVPLTISANASGQHRTDWVCLRLDRADWTVRAVVKEGTPGSGSPSLIRNNATTGVWEIPLALVSVPNGAGSVTVTRYEQFIGGRVSPCTSSTRPILPRRGDQIHETDTGRWLGWDGSAWRVLYDDSGVVVVDGSATPWSINVATVLERRTGVVCLRLGAFERTGGNLGGGTDSRLPVAIPSTYRHPNRDMHGIVYGATGAGRVTVYAANNTNGRAGEIWLTNHSGVPSGTSVTGSTISWVVG